MIKNTRKEVGWRGRVNNPGSSKRITNEEDKGQS